MSGNPVDRLRYRVNANGDRESRHIGRRLRYVAEPGTWTTMASDWRWARAGACPLPAVQDSSGTRPAVRWPASYHHPAADVFVRALRKGFEAVTDVTPADIPQQYWGVVVIEIDRGVARSRVAIDWDDLPDVNAQCAREVDTYFKFQYREGGYPELTNVLPGGYVSDAPLLYDHWCRLRAVRENARPTCDVFGRFGLRASAAIRENAIRLLQAEPDILYTGGSRATYGPRYLREMARARVCIDLPGRGPLCTRLIDGLAVGCCIVAVRHRAEMPVRLRQGVEIVYCKDDLSDLVDLCRAYARDDALRAPIEAAAARYFDENLHPVRMAETYLRVLGEPH